MLRLTDSRLVSPFCTADLLRPSSQNTSAANISVTGCLSHFVRARVREDGSCSGGVHLSVNTTTFSTSSGSSGGGRKDNVTNMPYPEPGDWYLTLAVRCYHQQLHARCGRYRWRGTVVSW